MKIFIMPNPEKDPELEYTKKAVPALEKGNELFIPEEFRERDGTLREKCKSGDKDGDYDLVIVLGGDGTVIRASHFASEKGIPLLGINLGKVGYLADIEKDRIELLGQLSERATETEERMMLRVELIRNGKRVFGPAHVLNDASLTHGNVSRLTRIELKCNGIRAGSYSGDGIIVATPTGSTAYSLSAGGPVIDPGLEGICVTPVCPHSLFSRSVIFGGDSVIEAVNKCESEGDLCLTLDGCETVLLEPGDEVRITESERKTRLLRFAGEEKNTFCRALYGKMSGNQ